jgi:hypothetical protein
VYVSWTRNLLIGAGSVVAIVGVAAYAFTRVMNDACGNTVLEQVVAPDGAHRIVVFQRACGATTGFSTQASLLDPSDQLPESSGNVFIADTDHGAAPSGPGGGPELRVRWLSAQRVEITHHRSARVFKSRKLMDGVRFDFAGFADKPRECVGTAAVCE